MVTSQIFVFNIQNAKAHLKSVDLGVHKLFENPVVNPSCNFEHLKHLKILQYVIKQTQSSELWDVYWDK